jgi:thiosulfate dehydrogenase
MKANVIVSLIVIFILFVVVLLLYYSYAREEHVEIVGGKKGEEYFSIDEPHDDKPAVKFDLVDPEGAPEEIYNQAMLGYHIMIDTKKNASEFVGNELNCNNCHFCAGNSLGGRNRGISLVGVTAMYPRYSKRDKKDISLVDRLSNCFKRSMNGIAPPNDSLQMQALVTYLTWISHEVQDAPKLPWLGLTPLSSKHVPNKVQGENVYNENCSLCHGPNGEGTSEVPPLWGDRSYNDGAGMNTMTMLSSFVWYNMPYGQPSLTEEEALDVAAYVISQPRPHFESK